MLELLQLIPTWLKAIVVLVVAGLIVWRWSSFRNRLKSRVDKTATAADVRALTKPVSEAIAQAVVKDLPSAIGAEQARELDNLRTQVAKLREAREWIKIAVVVHGYDDPYTEMKRPIYAPVMFNISTGDMRAPPLHQCLVSGNKDYYRYEMSGALKTALGSPRWQYVKDAPAGAILMLGVVYHYRSREPVVA